MSDLIIGLTGGIASGKSAVADRFLARGIVVADADVAARAVVEPGEPALAEIVAVFGDGLLQSDGRLDRGALRARVFADDDARRRLEAILHPRIRTMLRDTCAAATGPYVVVAIPLLAESGARTAYAWLDRILVVDVPEQLQRVRLMQRDGIDAALADRMLATQANRRERLAIADDVIVNDGPLQRLDAHVIALDARYRALATGHAP